MTKPKTTTKPGLDAFVVRHSSFVIRHSPASFVIFP